MSNPVYVKALADFVGAEVGELSFKAGDVLQLLEKDESGWSKCVLNGHKGWCPSDFCQPVASPAPSPAPSPRPVPHKAEPPAAAKKEPEKKTQAAAGSSAKNSSNKNSNSGNASNSSSQTDAAKKPADKKDGDSIRPVPAFAQALPLPRVGNEQTLVSPRGTQLKALKKAAKAEDTSEENLLNIFIGADAAKRDLYAQVLMANSANVASKSYPSPVEVYDGYLDEILRCLKLTNQREIANLPAPTSAADPLNGANAARLLDIFRNFILATSSQDSSFGLSEAVSAIVWLAKQLKLPSTIVVLDKKAAKKDVVIPSNTALEFLLSTLLQTLQAKDGSPDETRSIASLKGQVLTDVLTLCFECLPFGLAPNTRKLAAECLGVLSGYHLAATVDMFKEKMSKCKSDDDFRAFSHYQTAIRHVRFSLEPDLIQVLHQYLTFLIQVESKFSASSLRNAVSESLIGALQELRAPERLPSVADDQMRSQLGASMFKIYEFSLKKWIKKPKNRAAGFKLAMYMFLLFDPQRKDLNKKDITKIFIDQLKDSKQRLEGIESFSSFLRMLPADFAKPSNPGHKVFNAIITDAIPALFVKKTKDVTAVEWKELTGLLSIMLQLDESLLSNPTLVNVLKSPDYSIDSRCVVLRAFGGVVVNSTDANLGQSLQPAVTPIISQFCSNESYAHHLSSLLVCFPSLCIPESRRQIATALVPSALSSDPEIWTCSLQALQRFLLDDPDAHLPFLLTEAFKHLKSQAASADALVHVRAVSLLLTAFVNSHRTTKGNPASIPLEQAKVFCLCWLLHPDSAVVEEASAMLALIGRIHENDLFDILVNATALKDQRRNRKDKAEWIVALSSGLLADKDFEPLITGAWQQLSWNKAYATWYAKTMHVLTRGSGEHSQLAFDTVTQMLLCLTNDDLAPPVRTSICSALELLDPSAVESVARLAVTATGETSKRKGTKGGTTLRRGPKGAGASPAVTTELLMLRCYSILMRKVTPEVYESSAFLKTFLQERLAFWTSGQVEMATLDTNTNKTFLSRLVSAAFLLNQASGGAEGNASGPESLMSLVSSMTMGCFAEASSGAGGGASLPTGFQLAVAEAVRDFFRFSPMTTARLLSDWMPFAFQCANEWRSNAVVEDVIAEGVSALVDRFPAKLTEFVLDALREENLLLLLALCKTFERRIAFWMTKAGPQIILCVSLIKMCSPVSRARQLAVSLANTLGRENLSPGRELYYMEELDFNMYVQQAVDYSAAIAERRPNLTAKVFSAFATLFGGLSDQQKTLALLLLEPWTAQFGPMCKASLQDAREILGAMLNISVGSDPVFHRENLQRLYQALTIENDQIPVVVSFLVGHYAAQPEHCVLCLASLMRTKAANDIVVALEGTLRCYPEITLKSEVPTTAKSLDNFAEFDTAASAAFQMLQYCSLEHAELLYRFLPSILQNACVYYQSPVMVRNLAEALLRMDDIVPELKEAVQKLQQELDGIMGRFASDSVQKQDVDTIDGAFGDFCPGLMALWGDIALSWGLGNTITKSANVSTRLWGFMLEEELSLAQAQQVAFFCFSCLHNGWLSKLYRMLDVLESVLGSVSVKDTEAKTLLTQLLCALSVSCAPVQVQHALAALNAFSEAKQLCTALKAASGGSDAVFRATLMRPFFLESTREAGLLFLRSLLKNTGGGGGEQDAFASELALLLGAIYSQQTDALREDVYKWIVADKSLFDFVEMFGRKSFHLKDYERRKFCSDFIQLLLHKYPKGSAFDSLLILLRNSAVDSFKAPCFRLLNALLELCPQGPSKSEYKLLQELATFYIYNSSAEIRMAAEATLLDLIIQYSPDSGVPSQLLTLVRVIPGSLSVQLESEHLFPGDSEADYHVVLKRSEIAIATKCMGAGAATVNLVRDQAAFPLSQDAAAEAPQAPTEAPGAISAVKMAGVAIEASRLHFGQSIEKEAPAISEKPKQ